MKTNSQHRLEYCPVLSTCASLVFGFYSPLFFNVMMLPKGLADNKKTGDKDYFCDSGGFQIGKTEQMIGRGNKERRWKVIPGVGNRNTPKGPVIDPIEVIRQYGQAKIDYGFTIDFPMAWDDDFENNLDRSFEAAGLMFQWRPRLCPTTKLLVPLHYSTEDQLTRYLDRMSSLNPDGYAIHLQYGPSLREVLKMAYSLCFLANRGVDWLHILGTSSAKIIVLSGAAVGLRMFERISFDSSTWNRARYGMEYIDPATLRIRRIIGQNMLPLTLPDDLIAELHRQQIKLSERLTQQLILLHNVLAIDSYAQRMARRAADIKALKAFVRSEAHLKRERDRLLPAIDVLMAYRKHGFEAVESCLDWIWH